MKIFMGQTGSEEGTDMRTTATFRCLMLALACSGLFAAVPVKAQGNDTQNESTDIRWDFWLAMPSWPSLGDLQPVVGGSFNSVGYGLGGSVHWPMKATRNSALLLGFEGAVMATDSDIPVLLDDLLARDGYLALSARWMLGEARRVSLDAGLAYHLLDIAQLDTDYRSSFEFESWEESAAGLFAGFTWDLGANEPGAQSGLTLGLRAHFVDFGTVSDEDVLGSVVLGQDAGELDGPMYVLQIGYRW